MHTPSLYSKIKLNNGTEIPRIGLGVWESKEGGEVENAVSSALDANYRLIDTAAAYGNEAGVGTAIKAAVEEKGIPREEIFLTTKLWIEDQGYDSALRAFDASLGRLGLDCVDLYLIHWPLPKSGGVVERTRKESWKAMEEIVHSGRSRGIGVSNYSIQHLEEMKEYGDIVPAVNQVEFHPFLYQQKLAEYCLQHGIVLQAYSPLVHGRNLQDQRIASIADRLGVSNAQVLIRWSLQHGNIVIPKSVREDRIKENIDVFGFELSEEDMRNLDGFKETMRTSVWNPDDIE